MNSIEIIDFSVLSNTIKFKLNNNLNLSNDNIYIYLDDAFLSFSNFILSKDSQNNFYIVNLLGNPLYNKINFHILKDNIESNICTNFQNLKMINYESFSFNELNFSFPNSISSGNYDFYAFKFNDNLVSSNSIKFSLCKNINSQLSYIKERPDLIDPDNFTFEIVLFDENEQSVPDSNYILEIYS